MLMCYGCWTLLSIFRLSMKSLQKSLFYTLNRKFLSLSALMSEECNFNLYHQDLEQTLAANIPCIPFLGIFLTVVVQHDSYTQMSSKNMRRQSTLLETYTILDAITVRNRLEKLRWWSSIDFHSPPESPVILENDESSETILSETVQNGVMNDSISSLHSIPEFIIQHENASSGNGLIAPVLKQLGTMQAVNLDTQTDNLSSPAVASVSNNPLNSSPSENKAKSSTYESKSGVPYGSLSG